MSNVVELKTRKPFAPKIHRSDPRLRREDQQFTEYSACGECGETFFILMSGGTIHCGSCFTPVQNLITVAVRPQQGDAA